MSVAGRVDIEKGNNVITVLTTQLFFDDTLSDIINADVSPYNEHKNRDTYNDTDKIFTKEGLVKAEYNNTKVRWFQ